MDVTQLQKHVPSNGRLILGVLSETVPAFLGAHLALNRPLGYAVIDVDYYSSTVDALKIFAVHQISISRLRSSTWRQSSLCSTTRLQVSFLQSLIHAQTPLRKILQDDFLENTRIFRNADWIKHIYYLHVMDHPGWLRIANGAAEITQSVLAG